MLLEALLKEDPHLFPVPAMGMLEAQIKGEVAPVTGSPGLKETP